MKDVVINVENQVKNVNDISFLNKWTNEKNKSKFKTIFKTLYQQYLIELSEIVIYDAINFKRQSLKHYKNNIFLRELWKEIKFLRKTKKSNID